MGCRNGLVVTVNTFNFIDPRLNQAEVRHYCFANGKTNQNRGRDWRTLKGNVS